MNFSIDFTQTALNCAIDKLKVNSNNLQTEYVQRLLKHVAPQAVLENGDLSIYAFENKRIHLINYTDMHLNMKDSFELYIDEQFVTKFTAENYHVLAYTVTDTPEIICLEVQNDDAHEALPRQYIFKKDGTFTIESSVSINQEASSFPEQVFTPRIKLFSYAQLKNNQHIKAILEKLPQQAILVENPSCTLYKSRGDSQKKENRYC